MTESSLQFAALLEADALAEKRRRGQPACGCQL